IMVRGHFAAALSGVLLVLAGIHGDCINEDKLNEIRENMRNELAGMREQIHWQEEIHKLKLERIEVRFAILENKQSETLNSGSNNECPLALAAIQQLSDALDNQKTGREDECKCIQDHTTEQMSRLVAPKSASSRNETDKVYIDTTMDILTNSLSEMRTTLEDLQEKVGDIVASGSGDPELATRDNATTVPMGLDQVRIMVEGLQEKVDELTGSRQPLQQSERDRKPRDCHDIYVQGGRQDGVYNIFPGW
ncbi:unnamed protein product, partial [Meganyctiphanes norvegica]